MILAAVLVIAGAAGVAFSIIRSAEDRVTVDMVSRMERFAIPSEWKLESEIVRSERFWCMDTNPCPSPYRQWNAGRELTDEDVANVVSDVGFEMETEGPCQRQPNAIGPTTACSASGADSEYRAPF